MQNTLRVKYINKKNTLHSSIIYKEYIKCIGRIFGRFFFGRYIDIWEAWAVARAMYVMPQS